jgi:hypothetical protein
VASVKLKNYKVLDKDGNFYHVANTIVVSVDNLHAECRVIGLAETYNNVFVSFTSERDIHIVNFSNNASKSFKLKVNSIISQPANKKIIHNIINKKLSEINWESTIIEKADIVTSKISDAYQEIRQVFSPVVIEDVPEDFRIVSKLHNWEVKLPSTTDIKLGNFSILEIGATGNYKAKSEHTEDVYKYYNPSKFIFELMLHVADKQNNHYFLVTNKVDNLINTSEYATLGKLVWQNELKLGNFKNLQVSEITEINDNKFVKYITLNDLFESKVVVKGKVDDLGLNSTIDSVNFFHDSDTNNHIKFTLGFKAQRKVLSLVKVL